ncbi:chitinase [Drepanopeziza brunnea f. sp. 'multigermtubi' MB_m1]|uniref:chitinase n=1 Tax=Marssonina brunnea f. sp. multigermtubi (strain MB_m1) TaxID=1072389 RepID=K1X9W9_MARBU|nr:chitinase [Drepanopeziza brunnea f. sp. 'multigermtubi' MB_m1]EKD21822.1 chitinase [Drepanopeziza brunnea f. sp. 'multigermtubi' MB_m1]
MFGEYSVTLLVASVLALASSVLAGFDAASSKNVAVYWGQNSFGQVGSQASLAFYCEDTRIDIIPISFMISLRDRTLNLGPSSPDLEDDIKSCQRLGKTILLSFPGAYYTEGGFDSVEMAIKGAQDVWAAFGPVQAYSTISRPFGSAVVDGFDFDFESSDIGYIVAFGEELDRLRRYPSDKSIILTAAPQCPFPDQAMNELFEKIPFDALFIQFYNNYCGVKNFNPGADRSSFNFDAWDRWAKQESLSRRVKLLLGAPANVAAAGKGSYVEPYVLAQAIAESQKFESFGGVMFWDMTQLYSNVGFLDIVVGALEGNRFSTPSSEPAPSSTEPVCPSYGRRSRAILSRGFGGTLVLGTFGACSPLYGARCPPYGRRYGPIPSSSHHHCRLGQGVHHSGPRANDLDHQGRGTGAIASFSSPGQTRPTRPTRPSQ